MAALLMALKQATADLHREAETHVRILDADACDATYIRYLQRMHGFHAAIEDAFAQHAELAAAGFDARARRKQHMLVADLRALGAAPEAARPELPDVSGLARGLGAAYVVEGSTLGGAFVLARMRGRLGHVIPEASAFLSGYRRETGPRWRQFRAIAEHATMGAEGRAQAVASARATFAALIGWLSAADGVVRSRDRATTLDDEATQPIEIIPDKPGY